MKTKANVWIPGGFFECHRQPGQSQSLINLLGDYGYQVIDKTGRMYIGNCSAVVCGAFRYYGEVKAAIRQIWLKKIKVIHYNWDLYPFQLNDKGKDGRLTVNGSRWNEYVNLMRDDSCGEILVPSKCTIDRTVEFVGDARPITVIKSAVYPWEYEPWDGGYVLDVMRRYPEDPNNIATEEACKRLGLPCVMMDHRLSWDEFRRTVAGARVLVSPYWEASTGGLTLLEGYCFGKPVLLSNSPRNGGVDYLGDRATYFQWDDMNDLDSKLSELYNNSPKLDPAKCRDWVTEEYGEEVFAKRIAERLNVLLGI